MRAAAGDSSSDDEKYHSGSLVGTATHMVGAIVDGEEDNTLPMVLTAHATEPKKKEGHVTNQNSVVEAVMTHSFDTKRTYVIHDGSGRIDRMLLADVFGDRHMLTNIRTVPSKMRIVCNADEVVVTQMGDQKGCRPI